MPVAMGDECVLFKLRSVLEPKLDGIHKLVDQINIIGVPKIVPGVPAILVNGITA